MDKFNFNFEIKRAGDGIFIEGFANAATVDRSNELIDPKGWKLDNFKKNPIVLFDHGLDPQFGSLPIGKAVMVEAQDGGLFCKVKISDSKTEKITAIRDLVQEGILKTFSVGFRPNNSVDAGKGKTITDSELLEISVVPIPMNQDSTFSLLSAKLPENSSRLAKRWLKRYIANTQKSILETSKKESNYGNLELVAIKLDKSTFPSLVDSKKFMKDHGYSIDNILEYDNHTIFKQKNINDDNLIEVILESGVTALLKGEKMANANEKPSETTMNEEENEDKGCKDPKKKELSPEMAEMMDQYMGEATACANDSEGNPASWVGDEEAWKKAKAAADESIGREDPERFYALVTWLYLNKFGGTIKDTSNSNNTDEKAQNEMNVKAEAPIPTGHNAAPMPENPALDLQKQTNVLLGSVIMELQKISMKLEKEVEGELDDYAEPQESQPPIPPPAPEQSSFEKSVGGINDDLQKSILAIRKNQEELTNRLKKFS